MKSTILITPVDNIIDNAVVDNEKVTSGTYDTLMDVFVFYNEKRKEKRRANLMDVSLYEDLIIKDDIQYKILSMLSK